MECWVSADVADVVDCFHQGVGGFGVRPPDSLPGVSGKWSERHLTKFCLIPKSGVSGVKLGASFHGIMAFR